MGELQRRNESSITLRDIYDLLSASGRARRIEEATGRNALKLLEDMTPQVIVTVRRLAAMSDGSKTMDEVVAKQIEAAIQTSAIARARYYRRVSSGDDRSIQAY